MYVKPPGGQAFVLAHKPLRHQSAMQISVYDDRYRPRALASHPEWQRWRADAGGWTAPSASESKFQSSGASNGDWALLRYEHRVPDPEQWGAILNKEPAPRPARATLITDFYSYNTNMGADSSDLLDEGQRDHEGAWLQPHWVGDLTLFAKLEIKEVKPEGAVRLELVKAGRPHRCTIDPATGAAVVSRGDEVLGRWETPVKGPGRYDIEFANVDDRISLVVNGTPSGGSGFEYESKESVPIPTAADLAPAAIGVQNVSIVTSDLVLKRDIYYTQSPGRIDYGVVWEDHYPRTPTELFDFLSDPSRFPNLGRVSSHEYEVGANHYFMLGDNSPRSKDSRGWGNDDSMWDPSERKQHEVPRPLLTGKAFYVYWPHGVPIGPDIRNHARFSALLPPLLRAT